MESSASFGYWMRRRRKALDLTQQALAELAGYAATTIRKIESDSRRPSREMAERLAECLEIPESERAAFIQAARAELAVDRMQLPDDQLPELAANEHPAVGAEAFGVLDDFDEPPNNLPAQPTALVGRAELVQATCAHLLRPEVRLLTLTGAPGIGKSRLGLQVAVELLESFADGVFVINLIAVDTPIQLIEAIGQALSLRGQDAGPPLEQLKAALRRRE
ncbi:MAG TPA: helix-turn-helix domain-containing protein, partial [Roseiflexaceae bacterium]|nr:helix-turn-helix domain-containing protein [Roseiflexaceae bacterium]